MEYVLTDRDNNNETIDAKVFIDRDLIDKGTMKQIKLMIQHPAVEHSRFMPDVHRGKGCCVGFTGILTDRIVPNFIGGDIGCGMITYNVGSILKKYSIKRIEEIIRGRRSKSRRQIIIF